jgi:hypothetical protein
MKLANVKYRTYVWEASGWQRCWLRGGRHWSFQACIGLLRDGVACRHQPLNVSFDSWINYAINHESFAILNTRNKKFNQSWVDRICHTSDKTTSQKQDTCSKSQAFMRAVRRLFKLIRRWSSVYGLYLAPFRHNMIEGSVTETSFGICKVERKSNVASYVNAYIYSALIQPKEVVCYLAT